MLIRPVVLDDVPSIAGVYEYYVRHIIFTFEIDPLSTMDIAERIAQSRERGLDWLICESDDGELIGYPYARSYKAERPAYDCTVELSVYLRIESPQWIGKGLGRKLVTALLASIRSVRSDEPSEERYSQVLAVQARAHGVDNVVGGFYRALGFQHVGTLCRVGFKLGTWADVDFWQKDLKE